MSVNSLNVSYLDQQPGIERIREKVAQACKEAGVSLEQLAVRAGISETGFHSRFRDGTLQVRVLLAFADVLGIPAADLLPDNHRGEILQRAPGDRPYVEERMDKLEREIRSLRNEMKRK